MSGRIEVSDSVLIIVIAALLLDTTMLTIMFLVAALIHEIGHLIAIILCRCKILKIKLTVFGGVIKYHNYESKIKDIIIALSGSFMGFIASYISAKLVFFTFSGANLILSIVNLIPVMPLDGGRVAMIIFTNYNFISIIIKIIISIFAVIIFIYGKGISLILFACVLWFNADDIAKFKKIR